MHKCSRLVLVGRHGRPNSAHRRRNRQHARQERTDQPKSRILLNSRSHADNIPVTQTVSVFEFISSIKIDEMIPRMSALALQSRRCAVTPPPTHVLVSVCTAQRCAVICQQCLCNGKPTLRAQSASRSPDTPHVTEECSLPPYHCSHPVTRVYHVVPHSRHVRNPLVSVLVVHRRRYSLQLFLHSVMSGLKS